MCYTYFAMETGSSVELYAPKVQEEITFEDNQFASMLHCQRNWQWAISTELLFAIEGTVKKT
jgi:hypothetical protein